MEIRADSTSRCLDKKLVMMGYEIPDLLLIFFTISVLNFLFGKTDLKLLLVWLPSLTLAITLKIGKKGKPDNFLIHFVRFHLKPKYLPAFNEPTHWSPPARIKN